MNRIIFLLATFLPIYITVGQVKVEANTSHLCTHDNAEFFYNWNEINKAFSHQALIPEYSAESFFVFAFEKGYLSMQQYKDGVLKGEITKENAQQYWLSKLPYCLSLYNGIYQQELKLKESNQANKLLATCNNLDFSSNDFSNWVGKWNNQGTSGTSNGGTQGYGNITVTGINTGGFNSMDYIHEICNAGNDPHVPISRIPPGHVVSARLGNDSAYRKNSVNSSTGSNFLPFHHQSISNTFTVTQTNKTITYWYAVVLSQSKSAPHPSTMQPYFKIRMYDASNNEIVCANYDVNATSASTIGGFQNLTDPKGNDQFMYKDWTPVLIPLLNYIGQQVTIVFETSDCAGGGHFGYAYLAVDCAPFAGITIANDPCKPIQTLTAPPGLSNYSWTGSSPISGSTTGQSISVTTAGTYTVTMTTLGNNGTNCVFSLDTVITKANPLIHTSFTAPNVCLGSPTTFTDNSSLNGTTIVNAHWDFGDGASSTQLNPTHTYAQAGTFQVIYSLNLSNGCSQSDTAKVVVSPLPVASFTTGTVCLGQPTTFNNTSVSANTYHWNFGDPSSSTSTAVNPNFTYNSLNTFTVTLTVYSQGGCLDSIKKPVTVSPVPNLTLLPPTPVCSGVSIPSPTYSVSPNSPLVTFTWSNTNPQIGLTSAGTGIPSPFVAGSNTGTSNITGVVSIVPSLNGCVGAPASYTVAIKPSPVVNPSDVELCPAQFSVAIPFNSNPATAPGNINWTNITPGVFIGLTPVTGTGGIPSFVAINNTIKPAGIVIAVTATLNGCTGPKSTFSIDVNPKPLADFGTNIACEGNALTIYDSSKIGYGSIKQWLWDLNHDGIFSDALVQNPSWTFNTAGIHVVSLQVVSDKGCKADTSKPILVHESPKAYFKADSAGCTPFNTKFYGQATISAPQHIINWTWNYGDGTTQRKDSVAGTNAVFISKPKVFVNSSHQVNQYYTVGLIVTSNLGCIGSIKKLNYITVYPQPKAAFDWDSHEADIIDPLIQFYSGAIGATSYSWNFGDIFDTHLTNNTSNLINPSHLYNDQIPYSYTVEQVVKNKYGCVDSISEQVTIKPAFTFYIPNTFTPNHDGRNDGFKGTGIGINNATYNLWIFDRWGLNIFYSQDLEEVWDGTFNGNKAQEDTYVWKVEFKDNTGHSHYYKGIVNLVR